MLRLSPKSFDLTNLLVLTLKILFEKVNAKLKSLTRHVRQYTGRPRRVDLSFYIFVFRTAFKRGPTSGLRTRGPGAQN